MDIQNISLELLKGYERMATMVGHQKKILKSKCFKRPNTYIFVSFQGHSEVEKHCNL